VQGNSYAYTYDELNRLATAQSQAASGGDCWGQSYGYDIWANQLSATVTKCSAYMLSLTFNTKNQISNSGFGYDAAGNFRQGISVLGFTNLLRTGESVGSLPSGASGAQIATAVAEEGGRVGGTMLIVVGAAGPKTPATAESGAQVAGEIGKNRVTLGNGSQVDLAGKAHFEKTTQQSVPTPHIKDATVHTGPTGKSSVTYGPTRPATVGKVNAAARAAGANPPVRMPPPLPVPKPKRENQQ
jgi:hypothetical protein